ncbi:MAG: ROK family protein [Opitutales bacterium]
MKVLVVDIGGSNVKLLATGRRKRIKIPSGPELTPQDMVTAVLEQTQAAGWVFDVISIGYPGPVVDGKPLIEPKNLGDGWVDFDFEGAFGKPVKMINDAAMQALGSYNGGRMLFLGLGTGLGAALVINKTVQPLELAHLPFKKGKTFEEWLGVRSLEKLGKKKWRKLVAEAVPMLKMAMQAEYIVLGGGNAKELKELPEDCILGTNANAFKGGYRLWGKR